MPEIPAEAVQAAIDGVDHEYVDRCGFDRNVARAALTAAAPILAEQERADERRKTIEEIMSGPLRSHLEIVVRVRAHGYDGAKLDNEAREAFIDQVMELVEMSARGELHAR